MTQGAAQDPVTSSTLAAVRRMQEAVDRRDIDAFLAATTDDIVWETTSPPDGERHQGQAAVRAAGEEFFRSSPQSVFEVEELVALDDRAIMRWLYRWVDQAGASGHVRGVDIYRVREGKIAEVFSYVKG